MQGIILSLSTIKLLLMSTTFLSVLPAYIDPNTGGMLFQVLAVLLGVISAVLLFFSSRIKSYYYRVRRRVSKSDLDETVSNQVEETSVDQSEPPPV